jgi:hypothetical protein
MILKLIINETDFKDKTNANKEATFTQVTKALTNIFNGKVKEIEFVEKEDYIKITNKNENIIDFVGPITLFLQIDVKFEMPQQYVGKSNKNLMDLALNLFRTEEKAQEMLIDLCYSSKLEETLFGELNRKKYKYFALRYNIKKI